MITTDILLMMHFIGLSMAIGASISGKVLAMSVANMKMDKAKLKFIFDTRKVSLIADVGIILLLVSGVTLVALNPAYAKVGGVFFHVKMALIALVVAGIGGQHMMRAKLKRTGDLTYFKKVQVLSSITLISALAVVVMAVLAFH